VPRQPLLDIASVLAGIGSTLVATLPILLPLLLVTALVLLIVLTIKMMPRTSAAPLRASQTATVRFDDVAGVDEAKDELREIVEFLRDPRRFERLGARLPTGVLLHGAPGTGKTLLAKAVANESGAAFFAQSASSFVEMFAGLGASRIRKLFATARKHAPAIVFIDELDAVGAVRSGVSHNREQDQTLNQLLVELDGFDESRRVVVLAASNRLDALDPALLRPGRFDRQVHVGTPDLPGRVGILAVHTRGKPLAADVDLGAVARATSGLAGADLANICNEAAIRAGRTSRDEIDAGDFEWAIERVVAGLQARRVLTDKEQRVIAHHEAGHALVAHVLGGAGAVQKLTIVARGGALGYMLSLPEEDRYMRTREELLDTIRVALGGRAAEEAVFGRISTGASSDLELATATARAMVVDFGMGQTVRTRTLRGDAGALAPETLALRDAEEARLTDEAYADALAICERERDSLERLAAALLERETLDGAEVRELLASVAVESDASAWVGVAQLRGEPGAQPA
jgi:cell division protease FtsH